MDNKLSIVNFRVKYVYRFIMRCLVWIYSNFKWYRSNLIAALNRSDHRENMVELHRPLNHNKAQESTNPAHDFWNSWHAHGQQHKVVISLAASHVESNLLDHQRYYISSNSSGRKEITWSVLDVYYLSANNFPKWILQMKAHVSLATKMSPNSVWKHQSYETLKLMKNNYHH